MNTPTLGASAPAVFHFDSLNVRVVDRDGEPWFVAADVCAALDLPNATRALERLDDDEQALISIQGISRGNDQVNVINESGLYSLILGSRKPSAKRFKKWVTSEVLPAIRKTGSYAAQPELKFATPEEEAMNMAMDYVVKLLDAIEPAKRPRPDGDKMQELARTIITKWMLRTNRWMVAFNFQGQMQLTEVPFDAFMVSEADLPKMIASPDAISTASMVPIIMAAAERIGRRLQ